jgi:hypothetical protein
MRPPDCRVSGELKGQIPRGFVVLKAGGVGRIIPAGRRAGAGRRMMVDDEAAPRRSPALPT